MRPINLIPEDLRRGDGAPSRTGPFGWVLVGLLALAVGATVMLVTTSNALSERENEVAALQHAEQVAQRKATEVAPYTSFQATSEARRQTVASLAATRFDWERVMRELSLIIPEDVVVRTLTATVAPGVSVPGATSVSLRGEINGPALELTGCGVGPKRQAQETVARFIASLYDIDGVTRVGMTDSAVAGDGNAGQPIGAGACGNGEQTANFQLVAAFDTAPVPFAADQPVEPEPPADPEPPVGDDVEAANDEVASTTAGAESVKQAKKKARRATDRYLPGN